MSTITINGVEYTAKYSLRALFLYEKISGNNGFETRTTEDSFKFMYAMVKANNPDCTLTWDGFIDACENDPAVATSLGAILTDQVAEMNTLGTKKDGDEEAKKK